MTAFGWQHLTAADKNELLRRIESGDGGRGPLHVEIHPADRCNIDCFFCSTATLRGTDEVPFRTFAGFMHELRLAGTRSVRLAGGGEPLFHRQIREILAAIAKENLPIENITTNGVLVTDKVIPLLIDGCDEITLSLNTADPVTYASMMQTTEKNFERVVRNAKHLVEERDRRRSHRPRLVVQYLVWKENFRSIERMYDLAREIGAESIVFNGLSHLRPEQNMSEGETNEMMDLYRKVVQRDGYRRIDVINSFEQDLRPRVAAMNAELHQESENRSLVQRARGFFDQSDFSLSEKLKHRRRIRGMQKIERATSGQATSCLIGWYSMVVRTSGEVGPCCILQGKPMGNVYRQSLAEVWNSEGYAAFRGELHRMMNEGASWEAAPGDRYVEKLCGGAGAFCPISDFYYRSDPEFMGAFQEVLASRVSATEAGARTYTHS